MKFYISLRFLSMFGRRKITELPEWCIIRIKEAHKLSMIL